MRKLLLFLCCLFLSTLLAAQTDEINKKHQFTINAGSSLPLDSSRIAKFLGYYYVAYNGGLAITSDYTYNLHQNIRPTISFGYMQHFPTKNLEERLNREISNPDITRIEHEHGKYGLLHLMPGIEISNHHRLKCIGFFNFGAMAFLQLQQSYIHQYQNEVLVTIISADVNNGLTWVYKAGLRLQYPIYNNLNLSLQSEYLRTKGQANARTETIINGNLWEQSNFVQDFEMEAWNMMIGVSFGF